MACIRRAVAAALLGVTAGNFVSPITQLCLDIQAPCKDGSDTTGCERADASDITKEANVMMYTCHDEANQDFMVKEGHIINPVTGLCLDIYMPCADPAEEKDKSKTCTRATVADMKGKNATLNVQAYTCHEKKNQLWILMNNGTIVNEAMNMCMDIEAKLKANGERQSSTEIEKLANTQVYQCHTEVYGNQIWNLETTKDAEKAFAAKFGLPDLSTLQGQRSGNHLAFAFLGVSGMAAAMVTAGVLRMRRARNTVDEEQSLVPE